MSNTNRGAVLFLFGLIISSAQGAPYFLFADKPDTQLLPAPAESVRPSYVKNIRRSRHVNLAPVVRSAQGLAPGDVLTLNLFDDAVYTARIDRIHTNVNGTVSIRARIDNYSMGQLLLSTTGNESLGSIRIPEKALQYCIQANPAGSTHDLVEMNADGIEELPDGVSPIRPASLSEATQAVELLGQQVAAGPLDTANIDVMVVYTSRAMSWAGGADGIANVIAQAMEKAQLALDNSGTFLTMTLSQSVLVDYTESGSSSTDLNRLTFTTDGYMDQVHAWRYTYKADLVTLFAKVDDTGGLGWDLQSVSGEPAYGFSLVRVQQAAGTYTLIHELGHTMGCDHRKDQAAQPGPGLFSYSAGWRWIGNDGGKYCSVMSYEEDGYSRVGHFSNPNILYQGAATGDAADGDNARTLRETKHVIAAYRSPTGTLQVTLSPQGVIDAGAQWRRVGTSTWRSSGFAELYVSQGSHTIEFKTALGWARPANYSVSISENQLTETDGVYIRTQDVVIGTDTLSWEYPLATSFHDARTQTIYLAEEIGISRNIVALGLYVTQSPIQMMNHFTIRLKHTDLGVYGSLPSWESSGWTIVYQANKIITATGWVQFYFTNPFVYNGTANLMVDVSFDNSLCTMNGNCQYSVPGGIRTLYHRADSNPDNPLTWSDRFPTPSTSNCVANIKLVTTNRNCQSGDLNGTCGVDWQDLTLFASYWQRTDCADPGWCGGADFDQSGDVDFTDFASLAQHWLEGDIQYRPYDIVPDGRINIDDLLVLMEQWLDVPGDPSADIAPQPLDNFVDFEDFNLLAQHWLEGVEL